MHSTDQPTDKSWIKKIQTPIQFLKKVTERGFFHLLSVNFLVQFLGFGTSLLVSKFITPEELGTIKIIQSYTAFFWVLAGFGLNSAVLKFCSENRTDQERQGILKTSFGFSLISISVTLLIVWLLTSGGILASTPELGRWLIIYSLVIPFGAFTDILITYLQSQKKIKQMARAQAIIKSQSFILIVLSTWLFGIAGFIISTVFAFFLGLIPLLWQVGFSFLKVKFISLPKGFLSMAAFSVLANCVGIIRQNTDIYILDHFSLDRIEIGYYSLAALFVVAATHITATVQSISTPYFSERAKDLTWFRSKLVQTQAQTIGMSVVISIGVFILATVLVFWFYGPSYASTLTYLSILLLKYIITSSFAIIGIALFSLELVKYNFLASLISTFVGIGLSYLFLNSYGLPGVAWAQVIAALVNLSISLFFILRYFSTMRSMPSASN